MGNNKATYESMTEKYYELNARYESVLLEHDKKMKDANNALFTKALEKKECLEQITTGTVYKMSKLAKDILEITDANKDFLVDAVWVNKLFCDLVNKIKESAYEIVSTYKKESEVLISKGYAEKQKEASKQTLKDDRLYHLSVRVPAKYQSIEENQVGATICITGEKNGIDNFCLFDAPILGKYDALSNEICELITGRPVKPWGDLSDGEIDYSKNVYCFEVTPTTPNLKAKEAIEKLLSNNEYKKQYIDKLEESQKFDYENIAKAAKAKEKNKEATSYFNSYAIPRR